MKTTPTEKLLLVDDNPINLRVLSEALGPGGYHLLVAPSGEAALKIAARALPDLILLDLVMPGLSGLETCQALKANEATREIPVVFISAKGEMESVVNGFAAGGVDYIPKPFRAEEVLARVGNHLRARRLARALQAKNDELAASNAQLQQEIARREQAEGALEDADAKLTLLSSREAKQWNVAGLIGQSAALGKVLAEIRRLHAFPSTTALITGESGTGKELVARALHYGSPRARQPFVPVNCVAVPSELAESLFFGHVKGSFTGATSDRKGCFELADGGTLFLDEIGDMPALLQAKLLRVLEDQVITPVGSTQARRVDVRVIAATNADLDSQIASGAFRQDLFFRLARYLIQLPALRERSEDVPVLADHFLKTFAAEMGRGAPTIRADALAALAHYDFPGNVRELKNIIERALIESGGDPITAAHLQLRRSHAAVPSRPVVANGPDSSLPMNLERAEEALIQRALAQTGGNVSEAARMLGIHRTRIYRKMRPGDE